MQRHSSPKNLRRTQTLECVLRSNISPQKTTSPWHTSPCTTDSCFCSTAMSSAQVRCSSSHQVSVLTLRGSQGTLVLSSSHPSDSLIR